MQIMLDELKKFIAEKNLIKAGQKILLTVSGGIDSMVMAHLFLQLDYEIGVAHCNFSLRGKESDMDEELVRKYSTDHNLPFFTTRFETKEYMKKYGLSLQMAARELRYDWFEEIREKNNYDLIAVAHNLNDNIETLIINLIRGTGLTGLSGIRVISNRIIRPLLFATRQDIVIYCNNHNLVFREDKSNADTKYIRNKVRHMILPVLKEINPSIETTLTETAERFQGINEIVSEYIFRLREKITECNDNIVTFNIGLLRAHLNNKAILFELFRQYGVTNARLDDLIKIINGKTGGQIHTGTHRILKNRKELIVLYDENRNGISFKIKSIEDFKKIPGFESAELVTITDTFEISADQTIGYLDSEKLVFPLTIREWKAGDSFYPLGMKQKKKLSDYFIDNKYSILDKENKLILESDGKIVWIIGDRIDNRFKITRSTRIALVIQTAKKALIIKRLK
jgi:tRNA(Ile)-lysidine synthase